MPHDHYLKSFLSSRDCCEGYFLSIVSVSHAAYCHVNVLSSHVMLLTVRDLQLIGSKMNQLPAKFRTHDAILTDP